MAERLLSFGIFVLGMLVSGVPSVIFYTLKIDGIAEVYQQKISAKDDQIQSLSVNHKQYLAANDEKMQSLQSLVQQLTSDLAAKDVRLQKLQENVVALTGQINEQSKSSGKFEPNKLTGSSLTKAWVSMTSKEKQLAWMNEIRRVAGDFTMSDEECRKAFKTFGFSLRLQLQAKLQDTKNLRRAVIFHRDLHQDELAKSIIECALQKDQKIENYKRILNESQISQLLDSVRSNRLTMESSEAWERFLEFTDRDHRMEAIGRITNNEVLLAMPSLFGRSLGDMDAGDSTAIRYLGQEIDKLEIANNVEIQVYELWEAFIESPFEQYP